MLALVVIHCHGMGCNGLHQAPATWIGAFAFQCSTAHAFKFKLSGPCTASQSIQCSVSKMFRLVMCFRVVTYFGRICLSLKSEIFRILNFKFIFFSPTRVPNMGPFSCPESGQPKRGTHSAYPFWVVRFLGRKTAPYLGPRFGEKYN